MGIFLTQIKKDSDQKNSKSIGNIIHYFPSKQSILCVNNHVFFITFCISIDAVLINQVGMGIKVIKNCLLTTADPSEVLT